MLVLWSQHFQYLPTLLTFYIEYAMCLYFGADIMFSTPARGVFYLFIFFIIFLFFYFYFIYFFFVLLQL